MDLAPAPRPIRLFATDLDGTLLGPDLRLSPRTVRAFATVAERGCVVAIATGRMLTSATPFHEALRLEAPVITYNGAWIRCLKTQRDLRHAPVPAALASEAVAALEDAGLHVNLYLEDRVHARARTPEAEAYMAHARVEPVWCDGWDAVSGRAPTKILAIGDAARVQATLEALGPRFAGRLAMTQSMPTFIEVTRAEVNKGTALAQLAAHLGVERDEVLAVGDGMNDAEMLEWAGLGVAMGNAHPALKARADRVIGSVGEDGVAAMIEALIAEGRL